MFFSFPESFDKRDYCHPSGAIDPKVAYSPPQLWNNGVSLGVPKNLGLTSLYWNQSPIIPNYCLISM